MANVHVFCFFASYVVALALEGLGVARRSSRLRSLGFGFGLAGLLAHTFYLVARSNTSDLPPLLSSSHDWLLVLAWVAVVFDLTLSPMLSLVGKSAPVGLFLLPVVLLLIGASDLVGESTSVAMSSATDAVRRGAEERALRGWGMLHASLLVFGIAGVIVGFLFSLMYLVQHRRLKHPRAAGKALSLPSLATLARLNWWSVIVSFPLLTLGMLTGIRLVYLTRHTQGPISFSDPLVVGSGVVWLFMVGFLVWLLRADRLGGKQVALRTIWAFGLVLLTLLGLQVLFNGHTSAANRRDAASIDPWQSAEIQEVARQ
jgi:ABC-type transport system involved in cytochrome c biogenesis permease subunit